MRWAALLIPAVAFGAPSSSPPEFRVATRAVAGGAELITVLARIPEAPDPEAADVPLVSILRDTLGDADPENDRLRYVWVHTTPQPTLLQRGAEALPFFYLRPNLGKNPGRRPVPVLDLSAASHPVWTLLAASLAQTIALDPNGALIRSSTRSYRGNVVDLRRQQLVQALAVLSEVESLPQIKEVLSEPEWLEVEARLTLAGKPLGGLVSSERLPEAYIKQRTRTLEMRGHNWELLRQRAEAEGLYFQPLGIGPSAAYAMLWVARQDLRTKRGFNSRFLSIASPFGDSRLLTWAGYTAMRDAGGQTLEMIPLALYSLDYPKVPLLLVDFRASYGPKRREMLSRAADDTVSGVLGVSKFGNWPFFAGSWAWNFVRTRHGATSNRVARLNAYSEVRQWLALDPGLDEGLRKELQKRLDVMGVNPLEVSVFDQAAIARRQYAALLKFADDPKGLPLRLENDRRAELAAAGHGWVNRAGKRAAMFVTLGTYSPHDSRSDEALISAVDSQRRMNRYLRFLEEVAASGPHAEVVWNMNEVRRAIEEVGVRGFDARSAELIGRIRSQTSDPETQQACDRALTGADAGQ